MQLDYGDFKSKVLRIRLEKPHSKAFRVSVSIGWPIRWGKQQRFSCNECRELLQQAEKEATASLQVMAGAEELSVDAAVAAWRRAVTHLKCLGSLTLSPTSSTYSKKYDWSTLNVRVTSHKFFKEASPFHTFSSSYLPKWTCEITVMDSGHLCCARWRPPWPEWEKVIAVFVQFLPIKWQRLITLRGRGSVR